MSSDARPEPPALSPEQRRLLINLFREALHRVVDAEIDAGASPAELRETLAERRRLLESLIAAEDPGDDQ